MADILITDLTGGTPSGTGVFDQLMVAVKSHLEQEFKQQRIVGREYADVYLGSMQAVLAQSVQFLLEKDRAARQAELLAAQTLQVQAQTQLTEEERKRVIEQTKNIVSERLTMAKQRNKLDAEIDILNQQENNLKSEDVLTNQKILNLAAEKDTIYLQQEKLTAETGLINQNTKNAALAVRKLESDIKLVDQQILNAIEQIAKSQAETALINARTLTENEQPDKIIAETDFTVQRTANAVKEGVILDNQVNKLAAEIAILNQKKFTEEAQIKDIVDGATVAGILGKQKNLYEKQAEGFLRDAEQKAAKLWMDAYNVAATQDLLAVNPATAFVHSANVGEMMQKLAQGVNVSLTAQTP